MTDEVQERLARLLAEHGGIERYPMVWRMVDQDPILIGFFERKPSMIAPTEAIESFRAGEDFTVSCPKCGEPVEVGYPSFDNRIWVICRRGHELLRMVLNQERGDYLYGWHRFGQMKSEELDKIEGLRGKYSLLSPEEVHAAPKRAPIGSSRFTARQDNIADMRPDEVRRLLQSFRDDNPQVTLIWPSEKAGVRMSYADFVQHYDDLWYPSRDDLLIAADDSRWLMQIDHEEVITLAQSLITK